MDMFESIVQKLYDRQPLQSLAPRSVWDSELDEQIARIDVSQLCGGSEGKLTSALAVQSGLHLWNDSLDRSHTICQEIEEDSTGGYWHGILHRMEPDYSNSKYWFRLVGHHPLFEELQPQVSALLKGTDLSGMSKAWRETLEEITDQPTWNPYRFIDAIDQQMNEAGDESVRELLERIQRLEIALLLRYSYRECTGRVILDTI